MPGKVSGKCHEKLLCNNMSKKSLNFILVLLHFLYVAFRIIYILSYAGYLYVVQFSVFILCLQARSRTETAAPSETDNELRKNEHEIDTHKSPGSKTHGFSWRAVSSLAADGAESDEEVDKGDIRQQALAAIRANDVAVLQPLLAQLPINELDADQVVPLSFISISSPLCDALVFAA